VRNRGPSAFAVGIGLIVFAIVVTYLGFTKDIPLVNSPYTVKAAFRDTSGINNGSPVRIAGVDVGKVKNVAHTRPGARSATVTLAITDKGLPIYRDATAKIRPRIFLEGNFFVELSPGTARAGEMDGDATIPVARTASPVQFDQVLAALKSDTRADLRQVFAEVGTAIRSAITGARAVHIVGMAQDQLGYFYPPEDYPASELNPSDFILFNVSPTLADEVADAAALNAYRIGLVGVPRHPIPADRHPHAFFEPGVQFWPGVIESASRAVEFLVGGKPSLSPALPGSEHTVSPATVDFGDGSHATVTGEERITHTFAAPGSYEVTARVHDEKGQTRTWTRKVIVDPAPAAVVTQTARGGAVVLAASIKGGDGHAIAAHWEFADGTRVDGLRVSHGAAPGLTAKVTVVDGAGDPATATITL